MPDLKPYLTYEQQVRHLIDNHGLIVDDEKAAMLVLSHINYYRLSGYAIGLYQAPDNEWFRPGVTFDQMHRLYRFDMLLRNMMLPIIEYIEINLRTKIAYTFAGKYGALGYQNRQNFQKSSVRNGNDLFDLLSDRIRQDINHRKNLPFIQHHIQKYGGKFPLWVAIDVFSFGTLSRFYSLMLPEDQKAIALQYGLSSQRLASWISILNTVRNICAHYGRLYNMPLPAIPKLYREHQQYQSNRLFAVLLVIQRLTFGSAEWNTFLVNLQGLLDEHADVVNLSFIGFPSEWFDVLSAAPHYHVIHR